MPFRGSKSTEPASSSAPTDTASTRPASTPEAAPAESKSRFPNPFRRKETQTAAATAPAPGAAGTAEIPPRAKADFERAVGLMRSGKDTDAQLEFQQLVSAFPQFASPRINLGILHRKAGRLEQSETSLLEALARNRDNAIAWNELGVTQRMRGEFETAKDSYDNAIRIDPDYAPAYRNLGVLLDLYMGDANGALDNLERYQELTKEDKPVTGWIAELRQRTGRKAPRPPAPVEPAPAEDAAGATESTDDASGGANSDGTSNGGNASDGASGDGAPPKDAAPAEPKRAGA